LINEPDNLYRSPCNTLAKQVSKSSPAVADFAYMFNSS